MSDWTSGYVADIGYTYGCYNELNPLRTRLVFLSAGLIPPVAGTACELGFGQGLSVNLHAAASVCEWHGTDFNPSQAGFAQELAKVAGSQAHLFDEAFDEFCKRPELPSFDFIGLHGIWSWINDENRAVIVDFIRRKLKVGGVLYISYNTQPGWAAMVPMRDLLTEHAEVMAAPGRGIVNRIDAALEFAEKLMATNPVFARANPQAPERLKKLKEQNRSYLAHEYFNRDWLPMSFARMAEWLAPTKLEYAGSAHYLDHIDSMNLSTEQQALIKEIPDPMFQQTVRDFCVNQQFRRDYWVKGARRLNAMEQTQALLAEKVILVQPRSDVSLKVAGSLGEATMQASVYDPILDVLADHQPRTLGQIEEAVKGQASRAQVLQAMLVLTGSGAIMSVQPDADIQLARATTERLNTHIMQKACSSSDIHYLASPVTGGGVPIGRFHQMFLLARQQKQTPPADWAAFTWNLLQQQGQSIVKEGQALQTPEENLQELIRQASEFAEKRLPLLKALQIAV